MSKEKQNEKENVEHSTQLHDFAPQRKGMFWLSLQLSHNQAVTQIFK